MVECINAGIEAGENTLILEPRGFAKSTWGTTINLAHRIGREKDIRVGLISKSAQHADAFSRGIRWTVEGNARYKEIFGDLVSESKWTDSEWLRKGSRWHGSQYVTLFAQGVGGQIVSKRFDLILCDDILDKENTATPDQMQKTEDWFWQTLYPTLAPGGVVVMLGTRWAEGDLYEKVMEQGWRTLVRKALTKSKGHYRSLWPDYWPVEKLLEQRKQMGSARFACAMLNDITGLMEGNIFRREWFKWVPELPEGKYTIRMGVDLASSTKQRADYTARVITAEDRSGNYYVLSYFRDKIAGEHAKFVLRGFQTRDDISAVIIENQQFQSTLIQELMNEYPEIPVIGKRADSDKETRAQAVAAKYEAGKVYHLQPLTDSDFERELLMFPQGHDDLVDALGYSMNLGGGSRFVFGSLKR